MNHWKAKDLQRILMLVTHEPESTAGIKWTAKLCAQIGRTDIIIFTGSTQNPPCEYDGVIYTERVSYILSNTERRLFLLYRFIYKLIRGEERSPNLQVQRQPQGTSHSIKSRRNLRNRFSFGNSVIGGVINASGPIANLLYHFLFAVTLYRRARAISIIPRLIVCHGIYALAAGVRIKKLYGCPVVYDNHEFCSLPETSNWEKKLIARIERRLIPKADAVIDIQTEDYKKVIQDLYHREGG